MKRLAILTALTLIVLLVLLTYGTKHTGNLTILAVAEKENGMLLEGSIADLSLVIQPGTGKVYLDTQPASKLDTQMSTRLAKNIACRLVQQDCSRYDFFYTIKSGSAIIGGPSASSSVVILTAALLKGLPLRTDVAFTGTITSGNIVGGVAGIDKKIDAAASANITTVLIPAGSRFMPASTSRETVLNVSNATVSNTTELDLVAYGKEKGVTVIEVVTLDEAFFHFTGSSLLHKKKPLVIDPEYTKTMKELGLVLCDRSVGIRQKINNLLVKNQTANQTRKDEVQQAYQRGLNLTAKGEEAYNLGAYYSAASFCFGANVEYKGLRYKLAHLTGKQAKELFAAIAADVIKLNGRVNSYPIKTITDLQAYMIVKERLIEANDRLIELNKQVAVLPEDDIAAELGLVIERTYSALAWSSFFGKPGRMFEMNNESLRESCDRKLSETLEFYQYANILFPAALDEAHRQMEKATGFQQNGNYALCLFKAATAKAQINLLLSTISLKEEDLDALIGQKIAAAEDAIAQQQDDDIFPLLGYSYVEYAKTLRTETPISALLYAEYALELSNVDDYLNPLIGSRTIIKKDVALIFVAGILIGLLCAEVYHQLTRVREKRKGKKEEKQENKRKK